MAALDRRRSRGLDREMDASKLLSSSSVVVVVIVVAGSQVEDMMTTSGTLSLTHSRTAWPKGAQQSRREKRPTH